MKQARKAVQAMCRISAFVAVFCLLAGAFTAPATAYASGQNPQSIDDCPGEGIAAKIVPCIADFIAGKADEFFQQIEPILQGAIGALMVLAVTFFGVRLTFGEMQQAKKNTFVMIIKIGCVAFFTTNLSWIFHSALDILNGLVDSVSNFNFSSGQLHCKDDGAGMAGMGGGGGGAGAAGSGGTAKVWARMDCVLDMLIGVKAKGTVNEAGRGMFAFLYQSFLSGAAGVAISMIGTFMIFNIATGMFKAVMTYLLSLVSLVMLTVMGLLFIPLILLKQAGMSYFFKWAKMLGGMIIQPVVVFAFLNVVITAADVLIWSGKNSVFRTIAGDKVDQQDFSPSTWAKDNDLMTRRFATGSNVDLTPRTNALEPAEKAPLTYGGYGGDNASSCKGDTKDCKNQPSADDTGNVAIGFERDVFDYKKMEDQRSGGPQLPKGDNPGAGMLQGMGASMVLAALTSFLLVQLMNVMPRVAQDLAGGAKEIPDLGTGGAGFPGQQMLQRGTGNIGSAFAGMVSKR